MTKISVNRVKQIIQEELELLSEMVPPDFDPSTLEIDPEQNRFKVRAKKSRVEELGPDIQDIEGELQHYKGRWLPKPEGGFGYGEEGGPGKIGSLSSQASRQLRDRIDDLMGDVPGPDKVKKTVKGESLGRSLRGLLDIADRIGGEEGDQIRNYVEQVLNVKIGFDIKM